MIDNTRPATYSQSFTERFAGRCPFCKRATQKLDTTGRYYRIMCLNSNCFAMGPSKSSVLSAVRAWNNPIF